MLRNFFKRIALLELVTLFLAIVITLWRLEWRWDLLAVGYGLVYAGVVWLGIGMLALLGQIGGAGFSAYSRPGVPIRSDALLPVSSEERAARIREERRLRERFFVLALTVGGITLGLGLLLLQFGNP